MDTITALRVGFTVLMLLIFLGIVWWAYGSKRTRRFHIAAHSLLADSDVSTAIVGRRAK